MCGQGRSEQVPWLEVGAAGLQVLFVASLLGCLHMMKRPLGSAAAQTQANVQAVQESVKCLWIASSLLSSYSLDPPMFSLCCCLRRSRQAWRPASPASRS
jgi:hypothetical protein